MVFYAQSTGTVISGRGGGGGGGKGLALKVERVQNEKPTLSRRLHFHY